MSTDSGTFPAATTQRKKKTIIVAKKIVDNKPKKDIFVSRLAVTSSDLKEIETLTESNLGNSSPQHPTRNEKSNLILGRSILGSIDDFETIETKLEETVERSLGVAMKVNMAGKKLSRGLSRQRSSVSSPGSYSSRRPRVRLF